MLFRVSTCPRLSPGGCNPAQAGWRGGAPPPAAAGWHQQASPPAPVTPPAAAVWAAWLPGGCWLLLPGRAPLHPGCRLLCTAAWRAAAGLRLGAGGRAGQGRAGSGKLRVASGQIQGSGRAGQGKAMLTPSRSAVWRCSCRALCKSSGLHTPRTAKVANSRRPCRMGRLRTACPGQQSCGRCSVAPTFFQDLGVCPGTDPGSYSALLAAAWCRCCCCWPISCVPTALLLLRQALLCVLQQCRSDVPQLGAAGGRQLLLGQHPQLQFANIPGQDVCLNITILIPDLQSSTYVRSCCIFSCCVQLLLRPLPCAVEWQGGRPLPPLHTSCRHPTARAAAGQPGPQG